MLVAMENSYSKEDLMLAQAAHGGLVLAPVLIAAAILFKRRDSLFIVHHARLACCYQAVFSIVLLYVSYGPGEISKSPTVMPLVILFILIPLGCIALFGCISASKGSYFSFNP